MMNFDYNKELHGNLEFDPSDNGLSESEKGE